MGLDKNVIQKLIINNNVIKYFNPHVDETKVKDADPLLKELTNYNKNTEFVNGSFINERIHFLDI